MEGRLSNDNLRIRLDEPDAYDSGMYVWEDIVFLSGISWR